MGTRGWSSHTGGDSPRPRTRARPCATGRPGKEARDSTSGGMTTTLLEQSASQGTDGAAVILSVHHTWEATGLPTGKKQSSR